MPPPKPNPGQTLYADGTATARTAGLHKTIKVVTHMRARQERAKKWRPKAGGCYGSSAGGGSKQAASRQQAGSKQAASSKHANPTRSTAATWEGRAENAGTAVEIGKGGVRQDAGRTIKQVWERVRGVAAHDGRVAGGAGWLPTTPAGCWVTAVAAGLRRQRGQRRCCGGGRGG